MSPRIQEQEKSDQRKCNSWQLSRKLVLTVELRKKILALRDIIELPPCNSSIPIDKLMIKTMKDLHDLYPQILPIRLTEINGLSVSTYQVLTCFCEALEAFGEPPSVNEASWADTTKILDKLVERAIRAVDELIEKISERLDIMDYEYERRQFKPKADKVRKTQKEASGLLGYGPIKYPRSSPPISTVRVHAIGKLMPVELKQLVARVLPNVGDQSPRFSDQKQLSVEELETKMPIYEQTKNYDDQNEKLESPFSVMDHDARNNRSNVEIIELLVPIPTKSCEVKDTKATVTTTTAQVSLRPSLVEPNSRTLVAEATGPNLDPVPQPPPVLQPNIATTKAQVFLPPPLLVEPDSRNHVAESTGPNLEPVPQRPLVSQPNIGATVLALPQPATILSEGSGALPPPPKPTANKAGPPPPPPHGVAKSLRPKKATTKLKRSTYIINLYRVLKGKVEGCPVQQGKSSNGKSGCVESKVEAKQGLADALIEMTKRSAYFQQIEKDVKEHAKSVTQLKAAISTFKTANMTDLLQFHKHVESVLDKLTDETQVLAKFKGFPMKKLETLRMAATLYMKLETILNDLQNLKIEPPLCQLLQRVDKYFNKMRREIDAVERTKDEDNKKFQSDGIEFDFNIVIRIKEAMVDVSSNCMELILQERKNGKGSETAHDFGAKIGEQASAKGSAKLLWDFFQFAFRVYTFSGGHDDRADKLIQEIANEIQIDAPKN